MSAPEKAGPGPVVVLVGPPGSGKSTVARALAVRLGLTSRDTDEDVERTAGRSISDIFVQDGEPAFRAAETRAVIGAPVSFMTLRRQVTASVDADCKAVRVVSSRRPRASISSSGPSR